MKEKQEQQRIIFLEGKKVILRPLNKETDLPKAVLWMNDPDVRQFITRINPLTMAEEEKWFDNLTNRDNDILLAIETKEGRHIGILGLHHIDSVNRVAGHGIFIGEKDYWGKGYGTDAGMTLLNFVFNSLNLRKVRSSVIGYNKRSLNYHLRCGYQKIGISKGQFFRKGRYWDEILLEVFKKDWLVRFREYKKTD